MNDALFDAIFEEYGNLTNVIKEIESCGGIVPEKLCLAVESMGEIIEKLLDDVLSEIQTLQEEKTLTEEQREEYWKQMKKFERIVTRTELDFYIPVCENQFAGIWEYLSSEAQDVLLTAHYLCAMLRAKAADFAPAILEFGKTIEVELTEKLYKPYADEIIKNPKPLVEDTLGSYIKKYEKKNNFYIPFKVMVENVGVRQVTYNEYRDDLVVYMGQNNWDPIINNYRAYFITPGVEYADTYRNKAAHTVIKTESSLQDCISKTRYLLKAFLKASPYCDK